MGSEGECFYLGSLLQLCQDIHRSAARLIQQALVRSGELSRLHSSSSSPQALHDAAVIIWILKHATQL